MMKAKAATDVHIRINPIDLEVPPIGVLFQHATVEVEPVLYTGAPLADDSTPHHNHYLRDLNGWYYWAGAMHFDEQQISHVIEAPTHAATAAAWDYAQRLDFLPSGWRATAGKGMRIAILDTGFTLRHPTLKHLHRPGHLFDATRAGFAERPGTDPVESRIHHGTQVLSLLGARPSATFPIGGVAPQASFFLIKVADAAGRIAPQVLIDALAFAIEHLKVDLINCSVSVRIKAFNSEQRTQLKAIDQKLNQRNVLLCSALPNPGNTFELLTPRKLRMPTALSNSLRIGAISPSFFGKFKDKKFAPEIQVLATQPTITTCQGTQLVEVPLSSSLATPLLAGIATMALAHLGGRDALMQAHLQAPNIVSALLKLLRQKEVLLPLSEYDVDELLFLDPHLPPT